MSNCGSGWLQPKFCGSSAVRGGLRLSFARMRTFTSWKRGLLQRSRPGKKKKWSVTGLNVKRITKPLQKNIGGQTRNSGFNDASRHTNRHRLLLHRRQRQNSVRFSRRLAGVGNGDSCRTLASSDNLFILFRSTTGS